MSITVGDRVRRNPACYEGAWPASAWLDDIGVVTKVETSKIFGAVIAKVRWKHFESEVEIGRLMHATPAEEVGR